MELTREEAMDLVNRVGPHISSLCDHTYEPMYPKGRTDIAVVKRLAENGTSYGFDTLYLVWKTSDGSVHYAEIDSTRSTKDYLHVESVEVHGQQITVRYGSGGSFSGHPWKRTKNFML